MDTKNVSLIDSKELMVMSMKGTIACVLMGVGGTLVYQQVRNGNAKKYMNEVKRFAKKEMNCMYDELEDMM